MKLASRSTSLVLAVLSIIGTSCQVSPSDETEPEPDTAIKVNSSPPSEEMESVEITDVVLTSTESSCVTDVQTGRDFEGVLEVAESNDTCTFTTNQIPNRAIGAEANFAHDTNEVDGTYTIPSEPTVNETPTDLPFTVHTVMLNGVIWEAYPAACFDEGSNAILDQAAIGCGATCSTILGVTILGPT